ncbi:MAG: OmpP1/FadL family transporter, partial [Mucilaginibacter sp.]
WNAGIYYRPSDQLSLGFSHRSQVTTTINGGNAIFMVPASVQGNFPQPNTFSASIPLPATNSIGIGYYPTKDWIIAFDANFVGWNVYKALAFDYKTNTAALQDTYQPRNYKNATSIRLGGQYKTSDKLALRLGGGYATTAVQDGYVTPEAPDADRVFFTGGLGYKLTKHFDIDASFEYEHVMQRTQTNIQSQLSGTFKTEVYIPGISIAYHW